MEQADAETKARAQSLWDVDTGTPRTAGEEHESGESETDEQPRVEANDGEYEFVRGENDVVFVYYPGAADPGSYVATFEATEQGRAFDHGTVELRDGQWGRPVVTGNTQDEAEGGESEAEQETGSEPVPPPPPTPPTAGEQEGGEHEEEQEAGANEVPPPAPPNPPESGESESEQQPN
jgi:hypothetical protein